MNKPVRLPGLLVLLVLHLLLLVAALIPIMLRIFPAWTKTKVLEVIFWLSTMGVKWSSVDAFSSDRQIEMVGYELSILMCVVYAVLLFGAVGVHLVLERLRRGNGNITSH